MHLCSTTTAAKMLGLTAGTLRSWRRRGIGPSYVKQPGGYVRSRSGLTIKSPDGRLSLRIDGKLHWSDGKPHGSVYYPEDKLRAFVETRLVPYWRLPRPFPGRLPGGRNRTAAVAEEAAAGTVGSDPTDVGRLQLYDATAAARFLGVPPERLRSWRRHGIGPGFVKLPGGRVRRGKAQGHIRYPEGELVVFSVMLELQHARLPRNRAG